MAAATIKQFKAEQEARAALGQLVVNAERFPYLLSDLSPASQTKLTTILRDELSRVVAELGRETATK